MVKRKVDNRVRVLIENGVCSGYRTLFVLVGDKSREQVVYLHHMLSKTSLKQASVLWCYKRKLTFSSHRRKRMKQLKAKQQYGNAEVNEDDPFEMFVSMTDIRYCYYKETHKILGNTFKMCVIQDFEALTPNILCRTIETVEGGGVIVILLESMSSLKQLYTLNMDVHSRYRTETHQTVVPRFNERFILSLSSCPACLVMTDELQILPISSLTRDIQALPFSHTDPKRMSDKELELKALKMKYDNTEALGKIISMCKTFDQANVLSEFMSSITDKTLSSTITLTAARGRGKSAAMGLALAGAISAGYSNLFVTSPSPENLGTLFEFLLKGMDALGYEKHLHYQTLVSSDPEHRKAVMRITVTKEHRQIVQYISPSECDVLSNAELLVIDEAAAIPLPQVRALLGPYLVFLASTISGYEGTGRSLSLKLIKELRERSEGEGEGGGGEGKRGGGKRGTGRGGKAERKLVELSLSESIRYSEGDHVERWLYHLLCLESSPPALKGALPDPEDCDLFYVNRDTLFGYHKMSEKFLVRVLSLLVSSHYRNSPDDLQTLSDAPSHHLFALIPKRDTRDGVPVVYCVIQVSLEGKISKATVSSVSGGGASIGGKKPPGDLIPWTVSSLFQDEEFPQMSGGRVVRVATHPEAQGRGYGSRAMSLLLDYYNTTAARASTHDVSLPRHKHATVNFVRDHEVGLLDEAISPLGGEGGALPPLLLSLGEREAEPLHYLGVSFGASYPLVRFWKRAGYSCLYLSQVKNPLTGEHSCLFLRALNEGSDGAARSASWLRPLSLDFRRRALSLLGGPLRGLEPQFALSLLTDKVYKEKAKAPPFRYLRFHVSAPSLLLLSAFSRHQCPLDSLSHIMPKIAALYFSNRMPKCKLKALQAALLCSVGLQRKHPADVAAELGIDREAGMATFKAMMHQLNHVLSALWSACKEGEEIEREGGEGGEDQDREIATRVTAEVVSEIQQYTQRCETQRESVTAQLDLSQFVIKGKESQGKEDKPKREKRLSLDKSSDQNRKKVKR